MRPVYYVVISAILIILLIIFTTIAMVYYYRRYACYYNPSPWCHSDWSCEPTDDGFVDEAANSSCVVADCRSQFPNMPAMEFKCVMEACAPNDDGLYPCKCDFLWSGICNDISKCGNNPTTQNISL